MENKIELLLNKLLNGEYFNKRNYYKKEQDFLKDFKEYLKNNQTKAYELSMLKDVVLLGDFDSKDMNVMYLDRQLPLNVPNYVLDIQDIIKTYKKDKFSALRKVNGVYSHNNFVYKIDMFEKKFINAELYTDILIDLRGNLKYKADDPRKANAYLPLNRGDKYIIEDEVLQDIYDSGLSLMDYAYSHKIDYVKFNTVITTSKNVQIRDIKNRETTVEDKLVELIKKIANDEIDFMDYFRECKLNPKHLRPIVTKYKLQGKEISTFINKNSIEGNISLEKEEKAKVIINGIEVPYEVKKEAIEQITEVGAPLNNSNYKAMVKKLMKSRTI